MKQMSNRAYSLLNIKAVSENKRTITGVATTPSTDRVGDIIEPLGVKFSNPMPLLWQHHHDKPVGLVKFKKPTDAGIEFEAELPVVEESGTLRDRIEEAWQSIKANLVRAVSIGFRPIEYSFMDDGGIRFMESEVYELSLVTIPANADARITSAKRLDQSAIAVLKKFDVNVPAASGTVERPSPNAPGASGKAKSLSSPKGARNMKTIAEQISALEAKRAAHAARMEEIMTKAAEEGRSTETAEQEEFDTLSGEIETIDADLKRFRDLEKAKAYKATPITPAPVRTQPQPQQERSAGTSGAIIVGQKKLEPGIEFARLARVRAISHLDHINVRDVAKQLYGENSIVFNLVNKANVVAGSSISGNWAADLVGTETDVFADFVEFLRPMTIVGRFGAGGIPSLRRVPFRTRLIGQTGGGQAYWVGEGKPKPLTAFDFSGTSLDELKVATITVVTEELLRKSSPSADAILRDALAAAVAERIDTDFIDPDKAASSGVSPASVTNGVTPITSGGNTADDIREDVRQLMATFVAARNAPTSGVWIMSSATALALSLMVNPLGQPEFGGVTMNGGTFLGLPVITSEYLGSVSAGGFVVLANASDIYFADEGGVMIDISREASLQMLDNPTNDSVTPTATTMVSMWQTNSVAFRAERILNWAKRRPSAVALLDAVNWGVPGS